MEPVKVYIAAPWESKEAAKAARAKFIEAGFIVTSRWLDVEIAPNATEAELIIQKQEEAQHDVQDVFDADSLVLLNISKSEGKAVEMGLAIAWKRPVIIVGEPTNIFHHLPIPKVKDVDAAISQLQEWMAIYEKMRAETIALQEGK